MNSLVIDIKHIKRDEIESKLTLFDKLYNNRMYKLDGVFRSIWRYPLAYIREEAYIALGYVEDNLASLMFLPKGQWFRWDGIYPTLNETYGLIGFYTKPEYRNRGYAKQIFEKFDKDVHIRKLASSDHANNVISSVCTSEKFTFLT